MFNYVIVIKMYSTTPTANAAIAVITMATTNKKKKKN